jgi:tetratricopeptide (TPR) repeat protein/tRNA A-37 threonylcarbamoyl transferase component Bud32
MSDSPDDTLKRIVRAAGELSDPGERAAFLDRACEGDAAFLARARALLDAFLRSGGTFVPDGTTKLDDGSAPAPGGGTAAFVYDPGTSGGTIDSTPTVAADQAPTTVRSARHGATGSLGTVIAGRYTLIEVIGEGGMGSVYLAEQSEPVKRRVAIKLIKPGMDSKAVLARFDAERQALAVMDHPNIARIYDGGVTLSGQPFFVMELVNGVSLTEYCDSTRLSVAARLELFVSVCQAVQHAHQKGIIHRDLKPGNVLVTEVDGRPTPKVIDFGVAKATEQKLTELSFSDTGAIVGTPAYMSPEQADPTSMDIDTRTDVYALGVMLYELLTGSPPIDAKLFRRGAVLEMLRMVREVDPPRPSTKLSTADALPNIAANRSIDPRKLSKLLQGELDWVVMKALEKDRSRRYDTANGLARDIQRYLADEEVEARPPSAGYRMLKFFRRHRGQVIAAVAVAGSLVAGIVGTSLGLWRATVERASAIRAGEAEAVQRRQAEAATDQALIALQSFTDEFVERQFAARSTLTDNDRAILRKAALQWEAFANAQGDGARARSLRAEGLYRVAALRQRLGESAEAETGFRAALALLRPLSEEFANETLYTERVGTAHGRLGLLLRDLRRFDESEAEFVSGLNAWGNLVAGDPGNREFRRAEAEMWNGLGVVRRAAGNRAGARDCYQRARKILAELVAERPDDAVARRALATSHNNQGNMALAEGDPAFAETHYREGLRLRQKLADDFPGEGDVQADLAQSHYGLGDWFHARGDTPAALREYRLALELMKKVHARSPLLPQYRDTLSALHRNVGAMLRERRELPVALEEYRSSVRIQEKLAADFPDVPEYRRVLARERSALASVLVELRDWDSAAREFTLAADALEKLISEFPAPATFRATLAECRDGQGLLESARGAPEAAQARMDQALKLRSELAREFPNEPGFAVALLRSHWRQADERSTRGDSAGAIECYRRAITEAAKLLQQQPNVADHASSLFQLHFRVAYLNEKRGDFAQARAEYEKSLGVIEGLVKRLPSVAKHRVELVGCHTNLALMFARMREPALATRHSDEALRLSERLLAEFPEDVSVIVQWSGTQINRAGGMRAKGRAEEEIGILTPAIDRLEVALRKRPTDPMARMYLRNGLQERALCRDLLQRFAEAAGDWQRLWNLADSEEDRLLFRSKTAQSMVRTGDVPKALEIAESLAKVNQAPTIFARVRVFALAFGRTGTEAQANRSLELLRQLVAMGFRDAARLKADPDLAALRGRDDFKKLVKELENMSPPPPEAVPRKR